MEPVTYFKVQQFPIETVLALKSSKKIYVIFSTYGEREADGIYEKILLLKNSMTEYGSFIDEIFLNHRRIDAEQELTEVKALQACADIKIILGNNVVVPDMSDEPGKGADMRRTLYHINMHFKDKNAHDIVLVFLDADASPEYFGTHFVTALSGAILSGYDFAKASFWRELGRVKKLVAQPLFSLINHPCLNLLTDFAYPLSGEVAGTLAFFNAVSFWQCYGVETGMNIDAGFGGFRVADVNLGLYDHEHQSDFGIQKIAFSVMRTYLRQLVDYGVITLTDGAKISDIFKSSSINAQAEREDVEYGFDEKKYQPLNAILR